MYVLNSNQECDFSVKSPAVNKGNRCEYEPSEVLTIFDSILGGHNGCAPQTWEK